MARSSVDRRTGIPQHVGRLVQHVVRFGAGLAFLAGLTMIVRPGGSVRLDATPPPHLPQAHETKSSQARMVLDLEGGVRLSAPRGPWIDERFASLHEVERPRLLDATPLVGPVRRLAWIAPVPLPPGSVLEVPAAGARPHARLLVRSHLGFWLPLPARATRGPDGEPRLRVVIDAMPGPWVFAVTSSAHPPERFAAPSSLAYLEQLSWLDTEALPAAIDARRACQLQRREGGLLPAAVARGDDPLPSDPVALLDRAVERFHRARAAVRIRQSKSAWQRYREGIECLAAAKRKTDIYKYLYEIAEDDPTWPKGLPTVTKANAALETLCAGFAPWGLDLVERILQEDANVRERGFDLRVLKPLGQELWGDAVFAPRGKAARTKGPWEPALRKIARSQALEKEHVKRSVVLRLYSPRVLEKGVIEKVLDFTKDFICRWGPVVVGAWTGGLGGAAMPLIWAGADVAVTWLEQAAGTSPIEYLGFETGKNTVQVTLDMIAQQDDAVLHLLGHAVTTSTTGRYLALLDMGLAIALAYHQWDPGKIRALAEDAPLGYKLGEDGTVFGAAQPRVPPVVVIGWVDGLLPQVEKAPVYRRGGKFNRVWCFDYDVMYVSYVGHEGLTGSIPRGVYRTGNPELKPTIFPRGRDKKGIPWDKILEPLPEDWLPSVTCTKAPLEQGIGFDLRPEVIAAMATARNLDTPWEQVEIASLDIRAFLEVPDTPAQRLEFPLVETGTPAMWRRARRFAVRTTTEDHTATPANDAPHGFADAKALELPRLLTRYEIVLTDASEKREWCRLKVDFDAPGAQKFREERTSPDAILWDGDLEEVAWQTVHVKAKPTPPFRAALVNIHMPYRYRILGSLTAPTNEQAGNAFRTRNGDGPKLDWRGKTTTWTARQNKFEETYTLKLAERGTVIREFSYAQRHAERGLEEDFTLENIPMIFSERLEGTDLEMRFFGVRGADVAESVVRLPTPLHYDMEETDPETGKRVRVRRTVKYTSIGVPEPGRPCHVTVLMTNMAPNAVEELLKSGRVTTDAVDAFEERLRRATGAWWGLR